MRKFRLRKDLDRAVVDGFALPLGFEPEDVAAAPATGYTIAYNAGEEDDPDTYTFQVTVSWERLPDLVRRCFALLPEEVYAIVEIGSRDAYRSVDVFLGEDTISRDEFVEVWEEFEPFLLEDGSIAAGANAEEPFIEVFVDQRKTIIIHVPLSMRDEIESMLRELDLDEVPETWPEPESEHDEPRIRPVLDIRDAFSPDIDELLLQLRQRWRLELNLDPDRNVDEAGRELGLTLWHAVVIAYRRGDDNGDGAYLSLWATARSLAQMEEMIRESVGALDEWELGDIYTIDRVAFDERPDELGDLSPRYDEAKVHKLDVDPWGDPPSGGDDEDDDEDDDDDR